MKNEERAGKYRVWLKMNDTTHLISAISCVTVGAENLKMGSNITLSSVFSTMRTCSSATLLEGL